MDPVYAHKCDWCGEQYDNSYPLDPQTQGELDEFNKRLNNTGFQDLCGECIGPITELGSYAREINIQTEHASKEDAQSPQGA